MSGGRPRQETSLGPRLRRGVRRAAGGTRRELRRAARVAARVGRRVGRTAGQAVTASIVSGQGPPAEKRIRQVGPPAGGRGRPVPRVGWLPGAGRRVRYRGAGPGAPVLVVATLMALIVALLGIQGLTGVSLLPDRLTPGLRPAPREVPVLPASRPERIAIPSIEVDAPVHTVGLAPDGTIGVPTAERAQEAAWYDQGPTPGQDGPAVVVGHVDTSTGPAVFHKLGELRRGDRVRVGRVDGRVAVFEVESVERFDKERFPADEVFGDFSGPNLRLITCGGRWVGGRTGYADNVVVFAALVDAER